MRASLAPVVCLLLLAVLTVAPAAAQDVLGLWFDPDATENVAFTDNAWQPVTAYVILHEPLAGEPITGWECALDVVTDGPAPTLDVVYHGDGLNIDVPPHFRVGLGTSLPVEDRVVLATVNIIVPEAGQEITVYLKAYDPPSLEGVLGYPIWLPAYNHGTREITPLVSSSGCASLPVAWINHATPGTVPQITGPERICFDPDDPLTQEWHELLVNTSSVPIEGEVAIAGAGLRYRHSGGPYTDQPSWFHVEPGEFLELYVWFSNDPGVAQTGAITFGACGETVYACELSDDCGAAGLAHFEPPLLDFGAVPVGADSTRSARLINPTHQPLTVEFDLHQTDDGFTFFGDETVFTLYPADTVQFEIRFEGTYDRLYLAWLRTGIDGLQLPCQGFAYETCAFLAPVGRDYGYVAVTHSLTKPFEIVNHSAEDLTGNVTIYAGDQYIIDEGAGYYALAPGDTHHVRVRFEPGRESFFHDILYSGSDCGHISLVGHGYLPGAWHAADSTSWGQVAMGDTITHRFGVANTSSVVFGGAVALEDAGTDFFLAGGEGDYTIAPGDTHWVDISFAPTVTGPQVNTLSGGLGLESITVDGFGIEGHVVCVVAADSLVFPITLAEETSLVTLTVGNDGEEPMPVTATVAVGEDVFAVVAGGDPVEIDPGGQHEITVAFTPPQPGLYAGALDLGQVSCPAVDLAGDCYYWPVGAEIGVYFDSNFQVNTINFGIDDPEPVPIYIVLRPRDPEPGTFLDNWELLFYGLAPVHGTWLSEDYAGDGINAMDPPWFNVSLDTPLPMSGEMVVATLVYMPLLYTRFDVYSTRQAYNEWSWPTYQVQGEEDRWHATSDLGHRVAWIYVAVAVAAPTPEAVASPGRVSLSWHIDASPGRTCHVYRRQEGSMPARLTVDALPARKDVNQFEDAADGLPDGARLFYSYAILEGGAEIARSAEAQVTWRALPRVSALHPPYPNPFNPVTHLEYEVARPGHVTVRVYDLTGRLVATLADSHHETGGHEVRWQGVDNAGRPAASGTYYAIMKTEEVTRTRKLTLLK